MNNKETSHPRRQPEAGLMNGKLSEQNYSTTSSKNQLIFDLLPVGEGNAISSRDLADLVGAPSIRILQSRIADERADGYLILSKAHNGGGYFKPSPGHAGEVEISRFIATVRSRALNSLKILRGAKTALSDLDGQLDLDDLMTL